MTGAVLGSTHNCVDVVDEWDSKKILSMDIVMIRMVAMTILYPHTCNYISVSPWLVSAKIIIEI